MKEQIKNTSVYKRQNEDKSIDILYQFPEGTREVHKLETLDDTFYLLRKRVLQDYCDVLSKMKDSNMKKAKLLIWRKLIEEISCEDFQNMWSRYYFTPKQALLSACSCEQLQEQYKQLQHVHQLKRR